MKQPQRGKTVAPVAKEGVIRRKESEAEEAEVKASHREKPSDITKKGEPKMETKTAFAGFDPMNVSENVLKMIRFSLDTTFESVTKTQEFNDKLIRDLIIANKQIQANTEKMMTEWIENGKKGWDEYRRVVEEGYKKFEGFLQPQS